MSPELLNVGIVSSIFLLLVHALEQLMRLFQRLLKNMEFLFLFLLVILEIMRVITHLQQIQTFLQWVLLIKKMLCPVFLLLESVFVCMLLELILQVLGLVKKPIHSMVQGKFIKYINLNSTIIFSDTFL